MPNQELCNWSAYDAMPQTIKKCQTLGQFFESLYFQRSVYLCVAWYGIPTRDAFQSLIINWKVCAYSLY
jgi:hypothetical protein